MENNRSHKSGANRTLYNVAIKGPSERQAKVVKEEKGRQLIGGGIG